MQREREGSTLEERPREGKLKRILRGEVQELREVREKEEGKGLRVEGCEKKYTGRGTLSGEAQKDLGRGSASGTGQNIWKYGELKEVQEEK